MCLCLVVGFVGFILKQRKYLVMNDVTIPHALCIEKNIVYNVISFRERWYGFRKPQYGYPEHRITLCEINSIKTDNIDGYIINTGITCISSFTKNKIIIVISIYWSLTWESFEGNNSNDILSFNHYYLCLKWSTSLSGHKHLASNCKVIQWTFDIMLFPNFLSPSYMNEYAVCQLTYHGLVSYSVELRNMTWPGFNFYFGNTVYCGGLYSWFIKFL